MFLEGNIKVEFGSYSETIPSFVFPFVRVLPGKIVSIHWSRNSYEKNTVPNKLKLTFANGTTVL
jgi:hypothetical protein